MTPINSESWLLLKRTARFGDTDAAGVMHFYQLFRWSHEAWEQSLESYGIPAKNIFPVYSANNQEQISVALPIVHCEANFFLPIETGDELIVQLFPKKIDLGSFEIEIRFKRQNTDVARCLLRHLAINADSRSRCVLPEQIDLWLEASSVKLGIKPV